MALHHKRESNHAVEVTRSAVQLIDQLTEQGKSPEEIRDMFAMCMEAKNILVHLGWRLGDINTAKRELYVSALELVIEYIRNTRNPKADYGDMWDTECHTLDIVARFRRYEQNAPTPGQPAFNLLGFSSFYLQAANHIADWVKRGYWKHVSSRDERHHKEWKNTPVRDNDPYPEDGTDVSSWTSSDVARLAEASMDRAGQSG